MSKRQLILLFLCSLVPWTVGNGLVPILPVYALRIGASQALSGYYLSISFLGLAIGTYSAGWLSDKLQQRKLPLIITGFLMGPIILMMGRTRNFWQLTVLTTAIMFLAGVVIALVNILAGLFAEENERGKIYGIIGLTVSLGNIFGGLIVGPLVDRAGYQFMFSILALFALILIVSSFLLEEKKPEKDPTFKTNDSGIKPRLSKYFILLLLAHAVALIVNGTANMGRSLAMNNLNFSATAISSTGIITGVVLLPFSIVIGWISDKIGRKLFMIFCYLSYVICLILLAISKPIWQFWIATSFWGFGMISNSVGNAFVADLVPHESLGRGISLFQGFFWIANIIGLAITGYAIQKFGLAMTLLLGTILPIAGIILLIPIREGKNYRL